MKNTFKLHITHKAKTSEVSALAESTLTKQVFNNVKRNPWGLAYILRYLSSKMAKISSFQN